MGRTRVAVTGANGQIGSVLVRQMAETEHIEPVAICRNAVGTGLISHVDCDIRFGSVTDEEMVKRLLGDCDMIVNCALASGLPKESRLQNEAIIRNLAQLSNLKQVIYLSSVAVYGSCINANRSTYARPRPDTSYGKAKLHLERYATRTFSKLPLQYSILRPGHVYGVHQWLSGEIIELVQDASFCLPFDGNLPSNTIHVESLADALVWLILHPQSSGIYNLVDTPHRTWRQVFDWHTQALGLPSVKGMPAEVSQTLRESFVRRGNRPILVNSFIEIANWLRSLPFHELVSSDAIRELGYSIMMMAPLPVEKRLKRAYTAWSARRQIEALNKGMIIKARPWHYSDAMPGRYLEVPTKSVTCSEQSRELEHQLREWYLTVSGPQ